MKRFVMLLIGAALLAACGGGESKFDPGAWRTYVIGGTATPAVEDGGESSRDPKRDPPSGRQTLGVVTLDFEKIWWGTGPLPCGINTDYSCIAEWELDIVFEGTSDVGATITQGQLCYIWNDGKLFGNRAFGTGCWEPDEHEIRIDPHGAHRRRLGGTGLAGGHGVVYKYAGTDDEGNAIYLERALSAHTTISGVDIVERDEDWLADRPYKGWR